MEKWEKIVIKEYLHGEETVYGISAGTSKNLQSYVLYLSFEAVLLNLDSRDSDE